MGKTNIYRPYWNSLIIQRIYFILLLLPTFYLRQIGRFRIISIIFLYCNSLFSQFPSHTQKKEAKTAQKNVLTPGKRPRQSSPSNSDETVTKKQKTRPNVIQIIERRNYITRRSSINTNVSDSIVTSKETEPKNNSDEVTLRRTPLKVLFPWAKPVERKLELIYNLPSDSEDSNNKDDSIKFSEKYKEPKNLTKDNLNLKNTSSNVTQDMINNVAQKSSDKVYCKINGTSCHQCRQKTTDTKTVCQSGKCIGVRGNFCGPCLRSRYGEDAVKAITNPVRIYASMVGLKIFYNYSKFKYIFGFF